MALHVPKPRKAGMPRMKPAFRMPEKKNMLRLKTLGKGLTGKIKL